jgi:predicted PurR-regulated permease PerM
LIISENGQTLKEVIGAIGQWVQNPATDPRLFGIPVERNQVALWLDQVQSIFFNFWRTLVADFTTIALKIIVFFASLYVILLRGEHIWDKMMARVPPHRGIDGRGVGMCDGLCLSLIRGSVSGSAPRDTHRPGGPDHCW